MKSRLTHVAANGSVIAGDILMELRMNCDVSEIIRGGYNCFSTKRKRTSCFSYQKVRIVFTACNKDLRNENFPDKGNPNAPWYPENRTDLEPSTFIGLFKNLPEYSSEDIQYFARGISLDSKVSIKVCSSMNDFIEAYNETNYSMTADTDQSTLHNSCMRYETVRGTRRISIRISPGRKSWWQRITATTFWDVPLSGKTCGGKRRTVASPEFPSWTVSMCPIPLLRI